MRELNASAATEFSSMQNASQIMCRMNTAKRNWPVRWGLNGKQHKEDI